MDFHAKTLKMGDPKVCRACLTTKESFQYFLIDNISADAYYFCTSVQIQASEELPRALCTPCFEQLTLYSKFKQTCIDSQNTLLSYKTANEPCLIDDQPTTSVSDFDVKQENNFEHLNIVKFEPISDSELSNDFEAASSSQESQEEYCPPKETKTRVRTTSRAKKISLKRLHTCKALKTTRVSCDQCNQTFRKQTILDAHKLKHKGETRYPCYPCMKSFASPYGLIRHKENAHTRLPLSELTCTLCGRVCASRNALREHVRAHRQVIQFVCDLCGKEYTSKSNLKAHIQTHNPDRERLHTCKHCTKKFLTQRLLENHLQIHEERHYFTCHICNYPFTTKYSLTKHIHSVHEGVKPYKCDIPSCSKSFAKNESLKEHNRSHSGEKPYQCLYCSKCFTARRRLVDHHRIHTGEKPHQCTVCKQRFTQRGSLQRHMKVHNKA